MVRIGINARFLQSQMTGVERYANCVLEHLIPQAIKRGYKITAFVPEECEMPGYFLENEVRLVRSRIRGGSIGHHLWEQFLLGPWAKYEKVDVLLNLTNIAPLLFPANFITIHDLAWIENPKWFSPLFRMGYGLIVPIAARNALRIITVSKASAESISKTFQISDKKISIIHAGTSLSADPDEAVGIKILAQYGLSSRKYFLHVGTIQPRKNIGRLIEGHQLLCSQLENEAPNMVLAGGSSKHFAATFQRDPELEPLKNVCFLGYVPEEHLYALYANALAYVTASLSEGFNLPIVEAMQGRTPVLASDIAVHHEVAGDAAIYFDQTDPSSICSSLKRIVNDKELRTQLEEKGLIRSSNYSWAKHAETFLDRIDDEFCASTAS